VIDKKSSISRLSKPEKAEFTDVNEHFSGESNAESGLFLQALYKKSKLQRKLMPTKIEINNRLLIKRFSGREMNYFLT